DSEKRAKQNRHDGNGDAQSPVPTVPVIREPGAVEVVRAGAGLDDNAELAKLFETALLHERQVGKRHGCRCAEGAGAEQPVDQAVFGNRGDRRRNDRHVGRSAYHRSTCAMTVGLARSEPNLLLTVSVYGPRDCGATSSQYSAATAPTAALA